MRALRAILFVLSTSLTAAHAQQPPRVAPKPITKKNWRKHPAIAEVRDLVEANEAALKKGALKSEEKNVCESFALETDRTAARDVQGRIRKYVVAGGSDDSSYTLEHHYDDQGRLRFVFGRSGAVNDSALEHRIYFSVDGAVLWHDRKRSGIGYPWAEGWPENYVAKDAEKAWTSEPRDCPTSAPR